MEKIALISGGARGIGRAAAEIFIEHGFKVIILDRDAEELNKTCSQMTGAIPYNYDVSDEKVSNLSDAIRKGSMAFLKRKHSWISIFVIVLAILIPIKKNKKMLKFRFNKLKGNIFTKTHDIAKYLILKN